MVKIRGVTSRTLRRCSCISRCVAFQTIGGQVRSRQRESRRIMVKYIVGITGGVTGQASITLVDIPVYTAVLVVRFGIGVAGGTSKFGVVGWVRMAIRTSAPLTIVFATVNGEILPIVVKSSWCPGVFTVATGTIRRELSRCVVGLRGSGIVAIVATVAGIGRIVVVAVVASSAIVGNSGVRTV